jgi:hypothetical protein
MFAFFALAFGVGLCAGVLFGLVLGAKLAAEDIRQARLLHASAGSSSPGASGGAFDDLPLPFSLGEEV